MQVEQTLEVNEVIEKALELTEDKITLLELVKKAVPDLDEESIKKYVSFVVDGKKVEDFETLVGKENKVTVIPLFAGGH